MINDCAVFIYNDDNELEQLTVWVTEARALEYKNSDKYFPEKTKVVLKKIQP